MTMEDMRRKLSEDPNLYSPEALAPATVKFGEIRGVKVGKIWEDRKGCSEAGVHAPLVAGIWGSGREGAYSVVLSGGYEDDYDEGESFIYTGTGGRSGDGSYGGSAVQTENQSFEHPDNKALKISVETGKPVRVIRGPNKQSVFAPSVGYRYDGLYTVENAYLDKGKSGFLVCRYTFRRVQGQLPLPID